MNTIYEKLLNYLRNDVDAGQCDNERFNKLRDKLKIIVQNEQLTQRVIAQIKEKSNNTYPEIGLVTEILTFFHQGQATRSAEQKQSVSARTSRSYAEIDNKKRQAAEADYNKPQELNSQYIERVAAQPPQQPEITVAQKVAPKKTIFYFTLPDPMGFFWDDKKSLELKADSFFKLTQDEQNPKAGSLVLLNENAKTVKVLLSNPNMYLKPVCKAENEHYSGNSIAVLQPGSAELKNGKWLVAADSKVLIKIQ